MLVTMIDAQEWIKDYETWSESVPFLDNFGWIPEVVIFSSDFYILDSDAIDNWLTENLEGKYVLWNLSTVAFEFESDAIMFKVCWAN